MNNITFILHFCVLFILVTSEEMKGSFEFGSELDHMREQMSQIQRFMMNQAAQFNQLRDEMINQKKHLRDEVINQEKQLRDEMINQEKQLRDEMINQEKQMRDEMINQEKQLRDEVIKQEKQLRDEIELQSEEISLLHNEIQLLRKENGQLKSDVITSDTHGHGLEPRRPQKSAIYTAVGCMDDILSLHCHNGGVINVTEAFYGKNYFVCSTGCCGPHPSLDCKELVSESEPGDWAVLLYLCNNQTQCEYEYSGRFIQSCGVNYAADYMEINYICIGEEVQLPVGFSAYANASADLLVGEVIRYGELESNYGGFYNPLSSIFTCPLDGVYMFSATGYSRNVNLLYVALKIDGINLANFLSDDGTGCDQASSAFVITSCNAGQRVSAECLASSYLLATARLNTFSGYLLHIF